MSEWKSGAYAAPTRNAAQAERPSAEDDPLAEAVRSDAPREHRHESTDPLRTQQHADLAQRQAVLLPERGHEHRQPDRERGEARLSDRPGREDRPAVAHPRQSEA